MKNKRGEVATILMLGTLIVLGVTTVVSSLFTTSSQKKSSSTRASGCSPGTPVSGGYYTCAANCGKTDSGSCPSYAHNSKDSSCAACNSLPVGLADPTCKNATDVIKSGSAATDCSAMCASYGGYTSGTKYDNTTRKCCCKGTTAAETPPSGCITRDEIKCTGAYPYISTDNKWCCKTNQTGTTNSCTTGTEYVGGQAGSCAGTSGMCALNGKGYANKTWTDTKGLHCCCDGTATAAPSTQPSTAPAAGQCTTGQYFVGTQGYNKETPEQICGANGGTYVGNSQQGQVGDQRWACCKLTDTTLGFDGCCKAYRPGFYSCPEGLNKVSIYARSMSAVGMTSCAKYNTDTNTSLYFGCDPNKYTDGGCYAVWDGVGMTAEQKNNQATQLMSTPTPTPPPVPPPAVGCIQLGGECEIACGSVYPHGGTCTDGFCCPSASLPGVTGAMSNGVCSKNLKCKGINASFKGKSYSKKGVDYYTSENCTGTPISQDELHAYCSESVFTPWDNICIEQYGVGAYCPNNNVPPGTNFEKTTTPCGNSGRFCVKKKDEANYLQVRCSSIDPSYSPNYLVYQHNGQYYKKQGTEYVLYEENELAVYCSQNMGAIFDNGCKEKLQDATAECPLIGQKGPDYVTTNQKCGPLSLRYCVVKKKQEGTLNGKPKGEGGAPIQPEGENPAPAEGVTTDDTDIQCVQVVVAEGERFCELPTGEYLDLGPVQPSV